jgi:hypothetical protein
VRFGRGPSQEVHPLSVADDHRLIERVAGCVPRCDQERAGSRPRPGWGSEDWLAADAETGLKIRARRRVLLVALGLLILLRDEGVLRFPDLAENPVRESVVVREVDAAGAVLST